MQVNRILDQYIHLGLSLQYVFVSDRITSPCIKPSIQQNRSNNLDQVLFVWFEKYLGIHCKRRC